MDRFVTRTPTWKTLNYSSMAAQSLSQKKCVAKTTFVEIKKPFQQKQLSEISPHQNGLDKYVHKINSPNPDNAEQFNANSNDSGLSSASSTSPHRVVDNKINSHTKIVSPNKNHFGNLSDYIDCPIEKENVTHMTVPRTPTSRKIVESGLKAQKNFEDKENRNAEIWKAPEKQLPKASNMIMARIQRDFNSPSAASRMKAIKAMKSPTKSAYCQFDIPEAEQSLHLPEPPSLQEIMRNIVVYVEVRSGEDNRSAGVRKVIEALGARVSLSLNRETTHVIFKDGLLSTFKKATQMNIPIVSILWIEACKNQRRICDPKDFPISNLDRYENPELYTKMKRVKSMQPDSECNKRVRAKAGGTPKDSTPTQKTGNLKKTSSTLTDGTPTSSTNKKKTDISQFFKKIGRPTPTSNSKVDGGINDTNLAPESPATRLLNRIHSECYTPLNEAKTKTASHENKTNTQDYNETIYVGTKFQVGAKKTLNFLQSDNVEANMNASIRGNIVVGINTTIETSTLPNAHKKSRRLSLMSDCEVETATNSISTMAISVSTPCKSKNRRRSSIHTPKDMSLADETRTHVNNMEPILEKHNEEHNKQDKQPPKSINGRRTLYTANIIEETDLMKSLKNKEVKTPGTKSTRRSTLCPSKTMETSEITDIVSKVHSNVSSRRRTCFDLKSLEQTGISKANFDEAISVPSKDTEVYSKNSNHTKADEITTTSRATKAVQLTSCRRSLYGTKTIEDTNIATLNQNVTTASSICSTPTNFKTGRVTSSTLLDDSDNTIVATPPANATSGKLLEETKQCTTPLIFSSTRQPGNKRRTLFDVSMDIITQRLQCINQSARRSLAPATPVADAVNNIETHLNTPINIQKSNHFFSSTTPKSSTESLNECIDNNDVISVATQETNTLKKKRKLFMPNEMLVTPPPALSRSKNITLKTSEESNALVTPSSKSNSVTKRRRTLMPISQPQPTTTLTLKESIGNTPITPAVRKRRSTLDFEQMQTIKAKPIDVSEDSLPVPTVNMNFHQQQFITKKTPVLVYTNMHQQQIDVICEAIDKLGLFVLDSSVSNTSTHLVSLEPRRTLNLLRALARGLWILNYSWITDSLKAGIWLSEESYELQDFSRAIEICRSERQAFGNNYKCELFCKFGAFYISSNCRPISKDNLRELITLCGGHIVNTRQKARYIIGDGNRTLEDKLYLTPYWVLDSITQMQLMKVSKYMYPLPNAKTTSQTPTTE